MYKKKDILGLDIGTTVVKFVQLAPKGKLTKLIGYGKCEIPENIIIEGIISEPEKLAGQIKEALQNPPWGKITAQRVIASLPESRLFTRIIELPKIENKDMQEAVNYEMDQSIPIPSTDLYSDWEVIAENKERVTIFLAAAPKSIVDSYVQLFKEMKLEPIAFEISLAAIARAMVSNKEKGEPVLIIDIGGVTTNIAVFDNTLRVTGSYPIGGKIIRENLIKNFKLKEQEAEKIVKDGFKKDTKESGILKDEFANVVNEAKKVLDYFGEKSQKKISKILVCGGLAYIPGLPEYLKEELGIDSKLGNPWTNISIYPLKPVPKEEAAGYTAAVGLCMRGLENE